MPRTPPGVRTVVVQRLALQHLERAFAAWEDLLHALSSEALGSALPARSNTVGEQLWCVVGARESYTRGIAAGSWQGFACSLGPGNLEQPGSVLDALRESALAFAEAADGLEWTEARAGLLLDLLEHENQHQGQLIRYLYALDIAFPESWKQRWALD